MVTQPVFLEPVLRALDELQSSGREAIFWLRDDDASEDTPQLRHLLDLCTGHDIPILLAVIPEPAGDGLARLVKRHPPATAAVHGWRHRNHAAPGEKAQELGPHRAPEIVLDELRLGKERIDALFPGQNSSILVPPWNRIADEVAAGLPGLGFSALSTFADMQPAQGIEGLAQLNTHLDIIDWKGTRGGRDPVWLGNELAKIIRSHAQINLPVGILTHHLDHDDVAWHFLEDFLAETANHPAVSWSAAADLKRDEI